MKNEWEKNIHSVQWAGWSSVLHGIKENKIEWIDLNSRVFGGETNLAIMIRYNVFRFVQTMQESMIFMQSK